MFLRRCCMEFSVSPPFDPRLTFLKQTFLSEAPHTEMPNIVSLRMDEFDGGMSWSRAIEWSRKDLSFFWVQGTFLKTKKEIQFWIFGLQALIKKKEKPSFVMAQDPSTLDEADEFELRLPWLWRRTYMPLVKRKRTHQWKWGKSWVNSQAR